MDVANERVTNLINLVSVSNVAFDTWTTEDWSTYDTFETMFGLQIWDGTDVNTAALNGLQTLLKLGEKIYDGVSDIGGIDPSLDIWCDDAWETATDSDGSYFENEDGSVDLDYVWDNSGNNIGWIPPNPGVGLITCGNTESVVAYNLDHKVDDISIITICEDWLVDMIDSGKNLQSQSGTTYSAGATSLQDVVDSCLSVVLIHEFSHADAIMGSAYSTKDYTYNGEAAYGWENIVGLATQSSSQALYNADSIALFSAAMYMNKNTWWTGNSQPLSYTALSAGGLIFLAP
ncbi:hypothetical protein OCU04_002703 [Sclerotinia nivalis]|nr:hypothetical protein OCU04_002703 [Sclerotinia nivalis]